jgi:superfamily II DNA or RNA helicase
LDRPIVIGMVQTVRNHLPDLKYRFGCVICDEVDRFAAPTLRECVNEFPAAVRLGASDDERRRDGREFLLYDTFGPRGWRLKDNPECPIDIVTIPTNFEYSAGDIGHMTYEWNGVLDELVNDETRNELILTLAIREIDDGKRVLIWSDRVDHCKELKEAFLTRGYKAGLLIGTKQFKKEADATETGLTDGSIEVGIGTKVAEKGIDIPPLDTGIMTCASAGSKIYRFKQMRGRLARPHEGKEKATLYYLYDHLVPKLKKKKYNIRSLYSLKEMRLPHKHKESGTMPTTTVAVTQETLRAGAKQLGIKIPKGATAKKLTKLIERELSKDRTYGSYTCGACYKDIKDKLKVCPFCQAKFKPIAEDEEEKTEEEETEEEETEEEETEEEEELEDDGDEEEEDEDDDEEEEDDEEELEEEEDEEEEDEEEEDDDGEEEDDDGEEEDEDEEEEDEEEDELEEEEEEEEEEPEPPKKKKKAKKEKSKAEEKRKRKAKEKEKEAKREQIRTELPYTKKQLTAMKRSVLLMVASVLGIKNPLQLGNSEEMVRVILKVQKAKEGKGKSKGKKKKAATKKGKKAKSKKKKRK